MDGGNHDKEKKSLVVTQVVVGGFHRGVSARDLAEFLEQEVGTIWKCRLKRSWTPPNSYPDFSLATTSDVRKSDDYKKVIPHAFVHFVLPELAYKANEMARRCKLMLNGYPLKVYLAMNSCYKVAKRRAIDSYNFEDVSVEVGSLVSSGSFLTSWKGPKRGVNFCVDPFDATCKILFTRDTVFSFQDSAKKTVLKCNFKVQFSVRDIMNVKFYNKSASIVMLMHLRVPPLIYYRTADDDIHISVPFNLLDDEDPWIRTTDFTISATIGNCQFYKIKFSPRFEFSLDKVRAYFKDQSVLDCLPAKHPTVNDEPGYGNPVSNPFFSLMSVEGISFEVLYLVHCLVHKGIMSRHHLSEDFFSLLRMQSDDLNIAALQHIYSYRNPIFEAFEQLQTVQERLLRKPALVRGSQCTDYNMEVRRLVITPTTAYCLPPEVELSNRVLRNYKDISDRFIRVTFMDEGEQILNDSMLSYYPTPMIKKNSKVSSSGRTTIFRRVRHIFRNGFPLCGRHYTFLAFSSNQLRDRSAWFFAKHKHISAKSIRTWMGRFKNKNVAKYAARMGQCFSSTYATIDVPPCEVNLELPDVKRNIYTFSDGVGVITQELAKEVASKLDLTGNRPSGFQIRYAGCKGMVMCWPNLDHGCYKLLLRPSMNKFESRHSILEVVQWTRFQPGFLNREIITLLSALGVSGDVFMKMQDTMVHKLDEMLKNKDTAFEVLTSSCSELGNTAAIMLSAGFDPLGEPHLRDMIYCFRSGQLKDLLNKSRIFISHSRWLLGCMDELAILEYGQCFIQVSNPSLLGCFVKHGAKFSDRAPNVQVVTGTVVVAKNPCLHPGDIRILEAVDAPSLHHLVDCLVFPQKGERPHPNEASGSDLDGDIYFVTWDSGLIPSSKKSAPPMDYSPAQEKELKRRIKRDDIIDFFIESMLSDSLGRICSAHVVHADLSDLGAMDERCMELAKLAAIAVDYPKTGVQATLPRHLKPKVYPDFMRKEDSETYKSEKVLGHLYRKILGAYDKIIVEADGISYENLPYDFDLEIPGHELFLVDAWNHKFSYDQMLYHLMLRYNLHSEGEVVTSHFVFRPKHYSRKQQDLKEKVTNAFTTIHKEFRSIFEAVDSDTNASDDERNSILEQKASAWYCVAYHPHWVQKTMALQNSDDDNQVPLLLSFPWIAVDYLARLKIRRQSQEHLDAHKPINDLARYLAERK